MSASYRGSPVSFSPRSEWDVWDVSVRPVIFLSSVLL
jgi:hypothetical protein